MWISKIFTGLIFLSCGLAVRAQDSLLSGKELVQAHHSAETFVMMGNYKMAISIYKQLIELSPKNMQLNTELGNAYYLSADYNNAVTTLSPLLDMPNVTYKAYEILAATQLAQKNIKEAKIITNNGLTKFERSGALYHMRGNIEADQTHTAQALQSWINGIEAQPQYAPNYKAAATAYLETTEPLWGILYAESYLAMPHDSTGDAELKTKLYNGWTAFFEHITDKNELETTFEATVRKLYLQLSPTVSDGIGVENLTMIKTRFLMEWMTDHASAYPFELFNYQDQLIRNGWMDIYCEQLYGMNESKNQYDAWNRFHTNDIHRFLNWQADNYFRPSRATVLYNKSDEKMNRLFPKKKKR